MGFGQTVGEQRLLDTLTRNLPRIVQLLAKLVTAVEKNNELMARTDTVETSEPITREGLRGYMLEAMGRTPHDKCEEAGQ